MGGLPASVSPTKSTSTSPSAVRILIVLSLELVYHTLGNCHIKWLTSLFDPSGSSNQVMSMQKLNASDRLFLHECNRSLIVSALSMNAYERLHAFWPIVSPHPTCTNQDTRAFVTPKWPKCKFNSHGRASRLGIGQKAAMIQIHCPYSLIRCWPWCHID